MFDRLGRIESETPFVLEWFVAHGIEMWSINEGQQKIESHVDKLTNYIRFWQAAGESEKTAIRVKARMEQMTAEGIYTGGVVLHYYNSHSPDISYNEVHLRELTAVIISTTFSTQKISLWMHSNLFFKYSLITKNFQNRS